MTIQATSNNQATLFPHLQSGAKPAMSKVWGLLQVSREGKRKKLFLTVRAFYKRENGNVIKLLPIYQQDTDRFPLEICNEGRSMPLKSI